MFLLLTRCRWLIHADVSAVLVLTYLWGLCQAAKLSRRGYASPQCHRTPRVSMTTDDPSTPGQKQFVRVYNKKGRDERETEDNIRRKPYIYTRNQFVIFHVSTRVIRFHRDYSLVHLSFHHKIPFAKSFTLHRFCIICSSPCVPFLDISVVYLHWALQKGTTWHRHTYQIHDNNGAHFFIFHVLEEKCKTLSPSQQGLCKQLWDDFHCSQLSTGQSPLQRLCTYHQHWGPRREWHENSKAFHVTQVSVFQ